MSKTLKITTVVLIVVTVALAFGAGYRLADRECPEYDPGLDVVVQVWDRLVTDYVDTDKLDAGRLSEAAIEGMLEALDDPYTSYLDSEAYKLGLSDLEGKIEGIGAEVTVRDGQVVIVAPLVGSPAIEAGIQAGDIILAINGESAAEMAVAEAVLKIRGPKGTPVTITVIHEEESEPQDITIVRDEINLPSVIYDMRDDVAYIWITSFTERTDRELSEAIENMDTGTRGIVLDLRYNLGGILEATVSVAGHFLKEGVVVSVVDREEQTDYRAIKAASSVFTELPMVVLVNGYSASSAEVLAGALQDYERALIAGQKTYGKGSVNKIYQFEDGSGLYLTVARWLTPSGHVIEGQGLTPDYELELEGEAAIEWAVEYIKSL